MKLTKTRKIARRRGSAATEFALILPVLLMLIFGGIDFGRFAYTSVAVQNGARAGAAYAMMNRFATATKSAWDNAVRAAVEDEMELLAVPGGFDTSKLTVTTTSATESDGLSRVEVNVAYPFSSVVGFPWVPDSVGMRASVEARVIR